MTYLYLQTFLLLLAAYFLGAFLGCSIKRAIFRARHDKPTSVVMAEAPIPSPIAVAQSLARKGPAAPPVVPRSFDPVQPRIEVLRRPPPRPMPKLIDPSRFERALMGPDPNEGVPRTAIPEICPAVLKPVTGADRLALQGPPPLRSEPEISPPPRAVIEPAGPTIISPTLPTETPTELDEEAPPPEEPAKRASLSDATTSAAAAAVAAAKAAAAASIVRTLRRDDAKPAMEPSKEEPVEDERPEAVQVEEQVEADKREDVQAGDDQLEDTPTDDMLSDGGPVGETPDKDGEAIEEKIEEFPEQLAEEPVGEPQPVATPIIESGDDFQRIRAIDADLEQRLKAEGIDSFEHIAAWSASDVVRIGQLLGISDRIDREQWIEQAQILAKGGETYYSRNRLTAQKAAAAAPETAEVAAEQTSPPSEESQSESAPAPEPAGETPASEPEQRAVPEPDKPVSTPEPAPQLSGVAAAIHGRSVAEMAAAAAAAIAAASASVTRGLKPIEPISPLSKVDPKISIPAKLSDAIKENEASAAAPARTEVAPPRPMTASSLGPHDDLKRIRGVGVLIEKRLNAMGIARYEQIANWTSGEIDRVSQVLEFKGRIEREGWVEQARILLNGGQTEFSRRVDRGEVDTSRET